MEIARAYWFAVKKKVDKRLSNKNRCPGIFYRGDKNRSSEKTSEFIR